jgi:hypothetical protein
MRHLARPALVYGLALVLCTLLIPFLTHDEPPREQAVEWAPPSAFEKTVGAGLARVGLTLHMHKPARVGQVIIVGNETTPDSVIRGALSFYPGQVLHYSALRQSEKKLAETGLFIVDETRGIRPTITVLDDPTNSGPYKDILVNVQEPGANRANKTATTPACTPGAVMRPPSSTARSVQ